MDPGNWTGRFQEAPLPTSSKTCAQSASTRRFVSRSLESPTYPTRMAFRIMLKTGLRVSDKLAEWGVKSDRAYRALLNLAYWWHDPGVTARPLGKRANGKGRFWAQSQNPEHYPAMTDEQLVQIVFPTSAKKNFRDLLYDAHKVFLELQRAGEIAIIDGKPMPPPSPGER